MALHTSQFMDSMVKTCVPSAGQFFADKTCTNLVHKFVMHHVNYELHSLVHLWNISYFDCGWFKLAKGAELLCHDAIILGSFGHPKVISFRYNSPTGHSKISSFGIIFL
jgi:hypothetical protein